MMAEEFVRELDARNQAVLKRLEHSAINGLVFSRSPFLLFGQQSDGNENDQDPVIGEPNEFNMLQAIIRQGRRNHDTHII